MLSTLSRLPPLESGKRLGSSVPFLVFGALPFPLVLLEVLVFEVAVELSDMTPLFIALVEPLGAVASDSDVCTLSFLTVVLDT